VNALNSSTPPPVRRLHWASTLLFCVIIAAAVALFIWWRAETLAKESANAAQRLAANAATELRETLIELANAHPRILVNETVIFEESSPTLQLAVLQRDTAVEREFSHTRFFSTKKLRLRGEYRVKVGFDLSEPIVVDSENGIARVTLPHAAILGVEQKQLHVEELENGHWNRISAEDMEQELAALVEAAKAKAAAMNLAQQAEEQFAATLRQRVQKEMEILYRSPSLDHKP
jgi:hypothetical protein